MHPKRKQRLIMILVIVSGVALATTFVLLALQENLNAFYTAADIHEGKIPTAEHRMIRVGGLVVEGSVSREPGKLEVSFQLTDQLETLEVRFDGILPDLFREGQGIIAIGHLKEDASGLYVRANEVLAKHDETYMSPELKAAMEARGIHFVPDYAE
jgi:cytochrome c-type biogenesis protein CcmE